jgi:3-methyladenine DNA glycosylase AlkD
MQKTKTVKNAKKPASVEKKATAATAKTKAKAKKPVAKENAEVARDFEEEAAAAVVALEKLGSKTAREQMGPRYGIHTERAFGVPMNRIHAMAKELGKNHSLAGALWATGWYEARALATFVEEPARVTAAQMERWCRDFDTWAICDTVCMHLFDRLPNAFDKIVEWADRPGEFQKRAAFALLASVALHDKRAPDEPFLRSLPLLERAATDNRNFVKKAVSWALRAIARRSPALRSATLALARKLAAAEEAAPRWIGHDAKRAIEKSAK